MSHKTYSQRVNFIFKMFYCFQDHIKIRFFAVNHILHMLIVVFEDFDIFSLGINFIVPGLASSYLAHEQR